MTETELRDQLIAEFKVCTDMDGLPEELVKPEIEWLQTAPITRLLKNLTIKCLLVAAVPLGPGDSGLKRYLHSAIELMAAYTFPDSGTQDKELKN